MQDVGEKPNDPLRNVHDILLLKNPSRPRRLAIARLVRGLDKGPGAAVDKPARTRRPFIRSRECLLLRELEQLREQQQQAPSDSTAPLNLETSKWNWMEPSTLKIGVDSDDCFTSRIGWDLSSHHQERDIPLNLPPEAEDSLSFRGKHSRSEYMFTKKMPQVRRMVQRVQYLFATMGTQPRHIVDVGGGRCDLASALALAFPSCFVSVIDKNESSLTAGKAYAERLGCAGRMNFVSRDMAQVVGAMRRPKPAQENLGVRAPAAPKSPASGPLADFLNVTGAQQLPDVDLVVALHACGDLSDLALACANEMEVPFVICPCCYTKQYISNFTPAWNQYCSIALPSSTGDGAEGEMEGEITQEQCRNSLVRLAEIDDDMHISRLARVAINSMRLYGMKQIGGYHVSMEEYDIQSSRRNIVLVGNI